MKEPRRHEDARGWLMEFFRADEIDRAFLPAMGYLSMTKPSMSRGPHEHADQTDTIFFPGPGTFLVAIWDNREESPAYRHRIVLVAGGDRPTAVVVPPRVVHAYHCLSAEPGIVVNIPNRLYRGPGRTQPVDEVRHEDDPGDPFLADFARLVREHRR